MIEAFRIPPDRGAGAVRKAAQANRKATIRTVLRACRDCLIQGGRAPLDWLNPLQAEAEELEALINLVDAIPTDMMELRGAALELAQEVLRRSPAALVTGPLRAGALNSLSHCLSGLGRRERAPVAIKAAVGLYRVLAAIQPDALRPGLARAPGNLSNRFSDEGRREEALVALKRAAGLSCSLAATSHDALRRALARAFNDLSNQLPGLVRPA